MLSLPDTDSYYTALTMHVLSWLYLHRDVFFLAGLLWGEDIGDFLVRGGLAADSTLNGAPVRPHAVLLDNNWNALVTETVPARQYCPLRKKTQNVSQPDAIQDAFQKETKGAIILFPRYFMIYNKKPLSHKNKIILLNYFLVNNSFQFCSH